MTTWKVGGNFASKIIIENPSVAYTNEITNPDATNSTDNATEYDGETVTPVTHLTENGYSRTGYMFAGWNTRPDGSGTSYEDQAEIYNLCSADWQDRSTWDVEDHGQITLYAQWRENTGTFVIDATGGTYDGLERYSITGSYAAVYRIQEELLQPSPLLPT